MLKANRGNPANEGFGPARILAPLAFGFLVAWLVGANVYLFSFYLPTIPSLAILAAICLYGVQRWKRLFVLIPAATAIGGFVGFLATPAVSDRSFEIWTLLDLQSGSSGFLPLQNALIGASIAVLLFTWLYWLSLSGFDEKPKKSP